MAFLLRRSGRNLVRLASSSSWAAKPQLTRVPCLTSSSLINNTNCFSTAASSPGGMMNQHFKPKGFVADDAAWKDMVVSGKTLLDLIYESNSDDDAAFKATGVPATAVESFGKKFLDAIYLNKPLPSLVNDDDFDKFVDDLIDELPALNSASETDLSENNPKSVTPEMIKATSVFLDAITLGLLGKIPEPPAFMEKGDNFSFTTLDINGQLDLTVNVSGLAKEQLVVWVDKYRVLVSSTNDVAPDQQVGEAITMPDFHNYDADKVAGTIMEDGQLKISFPLSENGGQEKEEKYFEVTLV